MQSQDPTSNVNTNNNQNSNGTTDEDGDGILDTDDNCPSTENPSQGDVDEDGIGNFCDNCALISNVGQEDSDNDGVGDVCDNCPNDENADQADDDDDGFGNVCEPPSGSVSGRITPDEDSVLISVTRQGRRMPAFAGGMAKHRPGELIVAYDGIDEPQIREIQNAHRMTMRKRSPSGFDVYECDLGPCANTPQKQYLALLHEARRLSSLPGVRYAEPNYIREIKRLPDDPSYANQQWHYEAIGLPDTWDITVGEESIIVAVADTGILVDHPDFAGRLTDGYDFISNLGTANDGDGIDDNPDDPGDSLSGGSSFHGTHTAGTIGATTDNGEGVAGVTWNCKIMPLRALGVGGGSISDIVEAMRFAAGLENASDTVPEQRAHVLNLSLGGSAGEPESQTEREAIQAVVAAGVTVVAAAGNESSALEAPPASYPETISVGAVDAGLSLADYSNSGSTIDVVAPGGDVSADVNDDDISDGVFSTVGNDSGSDITFTYTFYEGTSMACPHVAGVCALMLSVNPDLTPGEIRSILAETATDLGDAGKDDVFGNGLVNALAAVQAAQSGDVPDAPALGVSNTFIDFGSTETESTVTISNVGSGVLEVTVTEEEDDGEDWMSIALDDGNDTTNVSLVTITIDRSELTEGIYTGTVTIDAEGLESQEISVIMQVAAPSFSEIIFIEAIADGQVIATTQTSEESNFDYLFDDLPVGDYIIMAGTDRDDDGIICEDGDLCGSFADTVVILEGESTTNIDFVITAVSN